MIFSIDARCLESQRGGPARYVVNLIKALPQRKEYDKIILYFHNYIPDDAFLKHTKIECKIISGPKIIKKKRIFSEQLLLNRAIKKDKPDVFFAPWYTAPWFIKVKTLIVAAWDISYTTHPKQFRFFDRLSLSPFSRHSCKMAQGIITCSYFDADQIEEYYKIDRERIHVVQFGAEERFKPLTKSKSEIKRIYNLPKKFLLSLGVIYSRRNVDVIVKAFEQIADKYPDLGLVVVGKNRTAPFVDIEGILEPLIKKGRAIYLDWLPEEHLVEMYQQAYYYICTSTCDGETILLKEAMSCGTPVITSPLLKEAVGDAGLIIQDPESVSETAQVLQEAFGSEKTHKRHRELGLKWVKQFSWNSLIEKSLKFILGR